MRRFEQELARNTRHDPIFIEANEYSFTEYNARTLYPAASTVLRICEQNWEL